jgi:hypothetical protein
MSNDVIPMRRGEAYITRETYEQHGAGYLQDLYPDSSIFVDGVPLDVLEDGLRCAWCDGEYIESDGPEWEDYGGYAHMQDCGVLVFADALVAAVEGDLGVEL